jgi:FAD binding domain
MISPTAIENFKASCEGKLLRPDDPGYDDARKIWNGMIDKRPALIGRCAGVADVIQCVNFAQANSMLVAVRGGGHTVTGNAMCDGGLVIDLSRMTSVHVDPGHRTARRIPVIRRGRAMTFLRSFQSVFSQIDCRNPLRFCIFNKTTTDRPNTWVKVLIVTAWLQMLTPLLPTGIQGGHRFLFVVFNVIEEQILFPIGRCHSFGMLSAVVFRHPVLPFQELRNGLRLDADFDPPQTCQEQVHLATKAFLTAQVFPRGAQLLDASVVDFQQTPPLRQLIGTDQPTRNQIKALASHSKFRLLPKRLGTVGKEIGTRDFALYQD